MASDLAHVFDQILQGFDIPTPEQAIKITQSKAAEQVSPLPYSFLTNLAHAALWQDLWLGALAGGRAKSTMQEWKNDFRIPDPSEFESLKERFIEGFRKAREIAASEPFTHKAESDALAKELLTRIAVHGAYHLGQMNLLRRAASPRKTSPKS